MKNPQGSRGFRGQKPSGLCKTEGYIGLLLTPRDPRIPLRLYRKIFLFYLTYVCATCTSSKVTDHRRGSKFDSYVSLKVTPSFFDRCLNPVQNCYIGTPIQSRNMYIYETFLSSSVVKKKAKRERRKKKFFLFFNPNFNNLGTYLVTILLESFKYRERRRRKNKNSFFGQYG